MGKWVDQKPRSPVARKRATLNEVNQGSGEVEVGGSVVDQGRKWTEWEGGTEPKFEACAEK